MTKRPKKKPKLYFSLRSPFSWMALRRLEERIPNADEVIDYIPFFDPDAETARLLAERGGEFHYTAMSKAKHLYILNDTKRLAAKFGYEMRWPVDVDPWWELPHLGWLKAKQLGLHREFYRAVTKARWERGENICDEQVLGPVLADAGLPVEPLLAAASDPRMRAAGVDALLSAHEDDIFGIPYFRWGMQKFWGLDRLADFLDVFEPTLAGEPAPAEPAPLDGIPAPALAMVGAFDHDTAGGCG
jgi:2-hydroxychromene-2-carboxylate isomerase